MILIEKHLLIDWQRCFNYEFIQKNINEYNLSLKEYLEYPALVDKIKIISNFYNVFVDDNRGSVPFNIYFIDDTSPKYELRNTSKGYRLVNSKLFDLKMFLRSKLNLGFQLHATDNIQETKHNLHALNIFDKYYTQKKFKNLNEVFDTLNKISSFKWVITHNFDSFDNDDDIDFLTNDYYKFMNILDTVEKPKGSWINSVSNGGVSVRNIIYVNNQEKPIDIRYLGDNFYDINLQNKILDTRIKHPNGFYIPNKEMHLYSLIYHAIIHKSNISDSYKQKFIEHGIKNNNINKDFLKIMLDKFMITNDYKYVRPEPSVGYFIN